MPRIAVADIPILAEKIVKAVSEHIRGESWMLRDGAVPAVIKILQNPQVATSEIEAMRKSLDTLENTRPSRS